MSDPKRATLITVGAPKSEKTKVNKTVRLTINLDESNESKYPELNYKELVIAEEQKLGKVPAAVVENGNVTKGDGLNPFSDNDDDVERVARKFEQKYGSNKTSSYGKKGRSKHDDFADIGAGYDENDSFIDNTDGYDEMIPPECDTLYGGFYINSGSLEFKNVDGQLPLSDEDLGAGRRNKRRISSSSSDDSSSDSSSGSSEDDNDKDKVPNGALHSASDTERRKKKNKLDKKNAKKIRRTDSSAATSGKQTSDDNGQADSDSRTSQSDSLASKPAPSSENPVTSDSSRDMDYKEVQLPTAVNDLLLELERCVRRRLQDDPATSVKDMEASAERYVIRLHRVLSTLPEAAVRAAWSLAGRTLATPRARLRLRAAALSDKCSGHTAIPTHTPVTQPQPTPPPIITAAATTTATAAPTTAPHHHHHNNKRKLQDEEDFSRLTPEEREKEIAATLLRLKTLIDERKPGMMANYNAECERVQEERKKIQIASAAEGVPCTEATQKRLPKRRFPWCVTSRALLARLVRLAGPRDGAARLLADRALPLFPTGFVRMPTLLRQADLSKEVKVTELKRARIGSSSLPQQSVSAPVIQTPINFMEPIQFPSSLTVTTMKTSPDKVDANLDHENFKNVTTLFGNLINSFGLNKDLVVEKQEDRRKETVIVDKAKEDLYLPPNNIGCITITPVPNNQSKEKKVTTTDKQKESGLIRIKSPAALNAEMHKKEKDRALENIHKTEKDKHKKEFNHVKEKRVQSPLHIDTSYQPKPKESTSTQSPKHKEDLLKTTHKSSKEDLLKIAHKSTKEDLLKITQKSSKEDLLKIAQKSSKEDLLKIAQKSSKEDLLKITQKQIETMRNAENNIPRPALVPVHVSPTFAKPDKRPPDLKKKKDILIISDVDPLGELEPLAIDDSSSDVEVIEEKSDKSVSVVPSNTSKDIQSQLSVSKVNPSVNHRMDMKEMDTKERRSSEDTTKEDFDSLMRNIRDLEHSQESSKFNSSSYGGVITSAKHVKIVRGELGPAIGKDKFAERRSLNNTDGCSGSDNFSDTVPPAPPVGSQ